MEDHSSRIQSLSEGQRRLLQRRLEKIRETRDGPQISGAAPARLQSGALRDEDELWRPERDIKFSLMFFSADGSTFEENKYEAVLDCARYADQNGFHAIWMPERHFTPFGGLYPSPSVLAAALAVRTERLQLRAGSVVMPLNDPLRVSEEWSMVDNLSNGRAGLAFASGWSPGDFVLAPHAYANRVDIMYERIKNVRLLWRGGTIPRKNGLGDVVQIGLLPRPVQKDLPIWITAMGSPDTFRRAGAIGANILTALIDQDLSQCAEKIKIYRDSLLEHGYDQGHGQVALMLHTYIGEDLEEVRNHVRAPFSQYLKTFLSTKIRDIDAFCREELGLTDVNNADKDAFFEAVYERYFDSRALFGTTASTQGMIRKCVEMGVDEFACLLDFGMAKADILSGLTHLAALRSRYALQPQLGKAC